MDIWRYLRLRYLLIAISVLSVVLFASIVIYTGHQQDNWQYISYPMARSGIYRAAANGNVLLLRYYIWKDPDLVNDVDSYGVTPLSLAVFYGNEKTADILIRKGARIDYTIAGGGNYLTAVCFAGCNNTLYWHSPCDMKKLLSAYPSVELTKLLLKNGINVNKMDDEGNSPLHYAAGCGSFELASYLIDNGANINAVNKDGLTPLMGVCIRTYCDLEDGKRMAELLVKNGAIINIKSNEGLDAYQYAMNKNRRIIADYLKRANQ